MLEASRGDYFAGTRVNVIEFLPQTSGPVLEVGCGRGGFRVHFDQSTEYWGVEANEGAAAIASQNLDRVFARPLDEVWTELPDHYFHVVVCNDLIEHLPDHDTFLDRIKSKLRAGGYLVGSIPNVRYAVNLLELLVKRDWHYRESGILDRTHLRFFTEKSLIRAFMTHGYCIEAMRGIDPAEVSFWDRRWLPLTLCSWILGSDTRFRQFGFRIRC